MPKIRIKNWDRWQTYRADRGQPPWIKLHRCLLRNPDWLALTDTQRGQLTALWILAADKNGKIDAPVDVIQRICCMKNAPDLQTLEKHGFISTWRHDGVTMASTRRHDGVTETETEESREDKDRPTREKTRQPAPVKNGIIKWDDRVNEFFNTIEPATLSQWTKSFPKMDVRQEIEKARSWLLAHPYKRKAFLKFLTNWLNSAQTDIDWRDRQKPAGQPSNLVNAKPKTEKTKWDYQREDAARKLAAMPDGEDE